MLVLKSATMQDFKHKHISGVCVDCAPPCIANNCARQRDIENPSFHDYISYDNIHELKQRIGKPSKLHTIIEESEMCIDCEQHKTNCIWYHADMCNFVRMRTGDYTDPWKDLSDEYIAKYYCFKCAENKSICICNDGENPYNDYYCEVCMDHGCEVCRWENIEKDYLISRINKMKEGRYPSYRRNRKPPQRFSPY
jgi:hypothetical protein